MHVSAIIPAPSTPDLPDFTPPPGIGQAFARYDLSAISSDQIDALVDELRRIGLQDTPFLLELETRGSRFRTRVASNLNACGIPRDIEVDTTTPINLIDVVKKQIAMAREHGHKTAFSERYLFKLESYLSAYYGTRARNERALRKLRVRRNKR